jgi:hypothetical protein
MSQRFNSQERLEILRAVDIQRHWHSLDEKRICILCEKIITGRQIEIRGRPGHYSLHCPTEDCPAAFSQWHLVRLPANKEFSFFPMEQEDFRFRDC